MQFKSHMWVAAAEQWDSKSVHEQSLIQGSSQYFQQSDSIIFTDTRAKAYLIFHCLPQQNQCICYRIFKKLEATRMDNCFLAILLLDNTIRELFFSVASFSCMCQWTCNIPFTFLHYSLLDFLPDLPSLFNILPYMVIPPYTTSSCMSLSFKS